MSPLMRELINLLVITVWFFGFMYGFFNTISGQGAEKSYDSLMKWTSLPKLTFMRRLFMPGNLSDKRVWRKQQRVVAFLGAPLFILGYVAAIINIANGRYLF